METAAKEAKKPVHCYSCGIDCARLRFHYAKTTPASATNNPSELKYDLCPNCYLQARMPSSHQATDFVKLEDPQYTTIADRDRPWSNSEVLLLLEALENFDDNWHQISRHVKSRTPEECVMKFLQLEIEDKYLDDPSEGTSSAMPATSGRDPVNQVDNPVLSVVTYLAQMAEPSVAAAAAGRSVNEIRREMQKKLENKPSAENKGKETETEQGQEKDKGKEAEVKGEDSMEVDTTEASSSAVAQAQTPEKSGTTSISTIALATSAARSGALASHEEREMTRLVGAAVNVTLQKLELKLAQFAELESIVDAERRELELGRQQLFLDRLAMKKRVKEVQDALKAASLESPETGAAMAGEAESIGIGNRYAFQPTGTDFGATGIQPLSAEGGDFKTFEI